MSRLTNHSGGDGAHSFASLVEGLAHVHARVLRDHVHDVQSHETKVMTSLEARTCTQQMSQITSHF